MELKQVIVIRSDLKLTKGKLAAQAAHASISSFLETSPQMAKLWKSQGQKKVVLKAKNKEDLLMLQDKCSKLGIPNALIFDAGRTEIKSGTLTALGIGPDKEEKINKDTGSLPLLK